MTNPAEKIRQVVEETAKSYYSIPQLKKTARDAQIALLDAIIAGMEERKALFPSEVVEQVASRQEQGDYWERGNIAAYEREIQVLKEVRTSITNNVHE